MLLSVSALEERERRIRREETYNLIKLAIQTDVIKPVHVPFDTLGKVMIERVKHDIGKRVLVVSDVGLLIAVLNERRTQCVKLTNELVFLCHTSEQREFATAIGVETWFIPYEKELDAFLVGDGKYNRDVMKKFDVLVGNPPFNPPKSGDGRGEGGRLWPRFIERALSMVSISGHVLFVTPNMWRRGKPRKRSQINVMQTLHNHCVAWESTSAHTSQSEFIDTDWWHVSMEGAPKDPILAKLNLLPSNDAEISLSIMRKLFDHNEPAVVVYNRNRGTHIDALCNVSPNVDEAPYRLVNNASKAREGRFAWSRQKPPLYDDLKVIVDDGRNTQATLYGSGFGHGEHTVAFAVNTEDEGNRLIEIIEGPVYAWIRSVLQDPRANGNPLYLLFALPQTVLSKPWQEVFGFTDEEVAYIKASVTDAK